MNSGEALLRFPHTRPALGHACFALCRWRVGRASVPPKLGRRHPDCEFSELHTQPTYSPVYTSRHASRHTAQNSRPSGSLLLSREDLSSSASCRFIPAHNSISFHEHRERQILTHLFSSISWWGRKATFFLHVFSITSPDYPAFFPPAFSATSPEHQANSLCLNEIEY